MKKKIVNEERRSGRGDGAGCYGVARDFVIINRLNRHAPRFILFVEIRKWQSFWFAKLTQLSQVMAP